uniref:Uncharacterized protein n=1 Tax=Candidatus Kentrum sp. TUN TaxID=2126343 RepID=A0A450ZZ32_9GAMM|nr:MAG: hypothetical protein BECKTUN1418D_GA0071000_10944 [Candidatus Kentron sp. TUN]
MNTRKYFLHCILVLTLIIPPIDTVFAEDKPEVKVTVYLTEETKACGKGRGYDDKPCKKLEFGNLDHLGEPIFSQIPPPLIDLKSLYERIADYHERCSIDYPCIEADQRLSVVLVFEFGFENPDGIKVLLIRKVPDDLKEYFDEHRSESILESGGRWINHQRADVFFPGYEVKWKLIAGKHPYDFGTMGK